MIAPGTSGAPAPEAGRAIPARRQAPDPRSALYRLLALGFRRPTPERFAMMRDGRFAGAVASILAALPHLAPLRPACDALRDARALEALSLDDLQAGLPRIFDGEASRGLHERDHARGRAAAILLELGVLHGTFKVAPGKDGDRPLAPDHLASELALLSYMCFVEAWLRAEGELERLEVCLLAERELLADHLARWVPSLSASLARAGENGWFAALTALAAGVVYEERRHVETLLEQLDDELPPDHLDPMERSRPDAPAPEAAPQLVQLGIGRPALR